MNKEQLQNLLHEEYTTENWKEVAKFVFPNVQFFQKPSIKEVNDDKVKFLKVLGSAKLNDGKNLAILEVTVSENTNIARNRVELWSKVNKLIDQERNHGLLVVFEQGKDDYRFTFTAKSTEFDNEKLDFVNRETDSKRFTYVLGKNESCKTPAERFYSLAQNKDKADIKAVEDAFSVEKLSKQFFKEYKEHYLKFVDYLVANNSYRTAIFKENEKDIRNFVKLLLGRLVFIQFVQKKKWMGVPADNTGWDSGDPKFLYNSFKDFKNKELFYSQFLEPLFYDALSKNERKNDIFTVTGTKIPFLNGGLFEKSNIDTSMLCFPAEYFSELFEFFDKYNFTINEYDPIEHEIGIDPEMLGSIFENLLEDNKDKGAFYTPKEIVHYMCQESLKEYLKTYLQEKKLWKENDELESALDVFVKKKEASGIIDYDEHLAIALRDVKICDPAIGSGAFPMGLLNEIYQCVYVLHSASPDVVGDVWNMGDVWQPDVVKKNIIQNSIYGVDIERGAVDIARLRFWLSLIIDEPEPHALPNLDYKIVVGNSLLSKYEDEVIDIDWSLNYMSYGLFEAEIAKEKENLLKKLSNKQIDFFNQNSDKTKLAIEIRNLKIDLIINQLQLMIDRQNIPNKPTEEAYRNKPKAKFIKDTELYLQTENWKKIKKQLNDLKAKPEKSLDFFDWKLDFPEIMNENVAKKVGFDIVIANPPYVSIRTKNFDNSAKESLKKNFKLATGQYDLYVLFIEKTHSILKTNGVMSYIIPKRMLSNESFELARLFVLENLSLYKYVDAEMPFDNANVEANIMFGKKNNISKEIESIFFDSNSKVFLLRTRVSSESIKKMPFNIFPLTFPESVLSLLFKIQEQNWPPLSNFLEITRGFECGYNDSAINNVQSDYKLLKADSIGKYVLKDHNYIYCNPDFSNSSKYKSRQLFETKPKLMTKFVANQINFSIDDVGYYNTNSVYNGLPIDNTSINLKYLLAILNSKVVTFWFNTAFLNTDTLFPHIQKNQLDSIPICISKEHENKLILLVDDIIAKKSSAIDTIKLEEDVDVLVYKLYRLCYEEVKIIDSNFSLTKEEYENIKLD